MKKKLNLKEIEINKPINVLVGLMKNKENGRRVENSCLKISR